MKANRTYIVFRVLTICLVLTLLFPVAHKFAHVFEHHKHKTCIGEDSTHIHHVDLDCDFQKFHLNKIYFSSLKQYHFVRNVTHFKHSFLTYKFLNNHLSLSFSLRGPPVLV